MQAKQLAQPVDVLIGTPQRLLQHAERGNLFYGCAKLAPASFHYLEKPTGLHPDADIECPL